jgi:lactate permease
VFGIYLTPINKLLSGYKIGLFFPRTETTLGFVNRAVESYSSISFLTTPGTLILISALLSIGFYKWKGLWKAEYGNDIFKSLIKQAVPSTVTVMTMSMMSVVMMEAGMIKIFAQGTAQMAGTLFPIVSPFIGILGAFMTGSNTSSNILFSVFQRDVANILDINNLIIAASQTTGGAIGKIITPMGVALGTGVTNIVGKEGEIIKKTIGYTIVMGLFIGLVAYILIYI